MPTPDPSGAPAPEPRYHVRLMFEWRGGTLWCGNDAARDEFDVGPIEDELPLTDATRQRLEELSDWHDTALNWDDPGGPGLWPPEEYDKFHQAAVEILGTIRSELGPDFRVEYRGP